MSNGFTKRAITLVFSLLSICSVAFAQAVSIDASGVTVRQAMDELKSKSGYSFVYSSGDINPNKIVTVKASQLNDAVAQILDGQGVTYQIQGKNIIVSKIPYEDSANDSKTKTVSGVIKDSNGQPIIGANIVVKGNSKIGTMSDLDGNFSLRVPENSTLEISYLGFSTQDVSVSGRSNFAIVLEEDTEMLNDVVVVGYGTQKRASVTGSVASIQTKDLITSKTPNLSNALAGKLPGLRAVQRSGAPGDDNASLDIRGFGSPLVIVDGVERDFRQIDANDIESISILKDVSAAVYGFKGANGVILVTTKKGTQGKPKITYNGYVGFQNITRYPEYFDAYEYATLYNEAQENIGITAPYSDEQLESYKNGTAGTDWYNEVVRKNAPTYYHNLSVSGGTEKIKYYFSIGMNDQEGIYKSKDYTYKKYNVRSNLTAEIVDGFTVELRLSGRLDNRDKFYEGDSMMRSIQVAHPTVSIYANDNEQYWANPGDKGNPIQLSDKDEVGYDKRVRREFNGSLTLNWEIPWVEGLSAKGLFSYDYKNTWSKKWYKEYAEYTYDASTDTYSVTNEHTISELTNRNDNYYKPEGQISLSYQHTFGKHDINALALFEFYDDKNEWVQAYRQFTIGAIDQINAGDKTNLSNGGNTSETAHAGLVGRINYAYASKYLIELSCRYDGSYKFDPDKRWGFFPAISLGWRLSEEDFFKNALPIFNNFKLRASYGKVGDEGDFSAFQYQTGYTYPSGSYILGDGGVTNGAKDKGMANTNLTWYESKTANVGLEAAILQGKVYGEFDFFERWREGLLATRLLTLPTTFGQSLPQENLNSDKTKGFEIVLGHKNTIGDFNYSISANFSSTRNYYRHVERAASSNMYDNWRNNTNDRYKDIQWGYVSLGQFQSYEEILNSPIQDGNGNKSLMPGDIKYKDLNNDGIINSNDQKPIGFGSTPRMYYGLNLYGEWKGFDATIFFQGAAGHEVFLSGDFMYPFIQQGIGNGCTVWLDRWHRVDPTDFSSEWISGDMPALRPTGFTLNALKSTWTRQKANYLRLKTLEIGYTLPKKWLERVKIDTFRIYFNSYNLATITNRKGFMKYMDPENNNSAFQYYPQMRSFNFGINLTF